jgi:nitrate reductase NapD
METMNATVEKKTSPVVISSLLVETTPAQTAQVAREIAQRDGVEVHSTHGTSIVVSIEAASINASYAIATALTATEGVTGVQLIYANFEDDPTIQRKLKR